MQTLHFVPHTHWDREWYLPFQVFRVKLVHLIDLLLAILRRDPDFRHFLLDGQTVVLEDYLAVRPENEAELIAHVRAGRLAVGPWYILPDEFLVSPEALIRNLLRGARLSARFGRRMDVGYLPDPFGHIGQMPQILRGFGLPAAAFSRGLGDEPCELWWESPDGSRVLLAYLREGYDNAARAPTTPEAFEGFVEQRRRALRDHSAGSHLLLLNGTDHHEPQPEVPALIAGARLDGAELRLSSLAEYMQSLAEDVQAGGAVLPIVRGEARGSRRKHLLPGVLSSRTWIKQRNHACETLLERWAEPCAALAELAAGQAPDRSAWTGHLATPRVRRPAALLEQAWRLLLLCQPHDSICGCSIDAVHEEMRSRFDQAEQIGEEIVRQSLTALAGLVDTRRDPEAAGALVVFSDLDPAPPACVRARFELPAGLDPFALHDDAGRPIPCRVLDRRTRQLADLEFDPDGLRGMLGLVEDGRALGMAVAAVAVVEAGRRATVDVVLSESGAPDPAAIEAAQARVEALAAAGVDRFRLHVHFPTEVEVEFLAPDLPPLGWRTYGLHPAAEAGAEPEPQPADTAENESLRVEAAPDGSLTLTDLRSGLRYEGLLRFEDRGDRGDSYTFCPIEGDLPIGDPVRVEPPRRWRHAWGQELRGGLTLRVPASLTPDRRARAAETVEVPIEWAVRLIDGAARADLTLTVDNTALDHRLQAVFPLGAALEHAVYDGAFEWVQRPTRIPEGDDDWIEQPAPEAPLREFIAGAAADRGLAVAVRGLREASASPQGELRITLLRCTGWLSRDDLATRKGGAGPALATPGLQSPGRLEAQLSLIPFQGDLAHAAALAAAFQSAPRAVVAGVQAGPLPPQGAWLRVDPPAFRLTAVKQAEDGDGLIVRGVNPGPHPLGVRLESLLPLEAAWLARMDETALDPLPIEVSHAVSLQAGAHQVVTLRLRTGTLAA